MKLHEASGVSELGTLVEGLALGAPVQVGEIDVIPIVCGRAGPDADLLEEAKAQVEEINRDGSVNTVMVKNEGGRLLLLIDGEQIIGAKQNRTINASFLVPPGSEAAIPVSCVEKGRWRYESSRFSGSGRTVVGSVRKSKLQRVTQSLAVGTGYDAKQGAVWDDVDAYLAKTRVASPTAALADAEEARAGAVDSDIETLAPVDGQVGFAAVHGDELVGIDLMGSPALYARAWRKLLRGVLLDVYERKPKGDPVAIVNRMLEAVRGAKVVRQKAPGCGETLATDSDRVACTAIAHDGYVYHAAIAPAE